MFIGVQFAYSALFQPFSVVEGLKLRFETSNITRWTMYISARIAQAILNNCRKQEYVSWIDVFHHRICESSAVTALEPGDLLARLSGLQDVSLVRCISRIPPLIVRCSSISVQSQCLEARMAIYYSGNAHRYSSNSQPAVLDTGLQISQSQYDASSISGNTTQPCLFSSTRFLRWRLAFLR